MISTTEIDGAWIADVSGNNKADPVLVEKVIRALLLLEGLVKQEVQFVFKGGTALMLHFDSTKRLSIDIDIIVSDRELDLDKVLASLIKEQEFTRYELQERKAQSDIEKAHYKLFYEPVRASAKKEEYVLLDILFENVYYTNQIELPIQSHFLPQDGEPLRVPIPSIEDLLGDKLTAFAPSTTGIPYVRGDNSMSMEIIKQLYDIGNLFDAAADLEIVKQTFAKFAEAELAYRDRGDLTADDVLEDILQTSLAISTRGLEGDADFEELQNGIKRITSFIFSEKYHLEKAIAHASRAAYMATLLRHDAAHIERFDPSINMRDWKIEDPLPNRLNKLKKSDPESYFYWFKVYEMQRE